MNNPKAHGRSLITCRFSSLEDDPSDYEGLLNRPLPLDPYAFNRAGSPAWTYRMYFEAIKGILAGNDFAALKEAVASQLNLPGSDVSLEQVHISSEKHGNWYQPARVEVLTEKGRALFVLNAALTERGQLILEGEFKTLKALNDRYPYHWLPTPYFQTRAGSDLPFSEGGGNSISFFLADWFDGFYEFHLSFDPLSQSQGLLLWDGSQSPYYLSKDQEEEVYSQIARILTCYYNPFTYEQIFPWHHGAGDFVVRSAGGPMEVRLVTARQYGPLVDPQRTNPEEALLFFFLNLSLRMRLDRMDGMGELTWAGEECAVSTWKGFCQGLRIKEENENLDKNIFKDFFKWTANLSLQGFTEKFSELLSSYDPQAPDLCVINKNIVPHVLTVFKTVSCPENRCKPLGI